MEFRQNTLLMAVSEIVNIPILLFFSYSISNLMPFVQDGDFDTVRNKSFWIIVIAIVLGVIKMTFCRFTSKKVELNNHKCRMSFYESYLDNYKEKNWTLGQVATVFDNDYEQVARFHSATLPGILSGGISILILIYTIAISNLYMAILFLGLSLIQAIPILLFKYRIMVNYQGVLEHEEKITDALLERYDSNFTTRLLNLQQYFNEKLLKLHKEYYILGKDSERDLTQTNAANDGIRYILMYGTYSIVALCYMNRLVNLEESVAIALLTGSLYGSVQNVFQNVSEVYKYKVSLGRVEIFNRNSKQKRSGISVEISNASSNFNDQKSEVVLKANDLSVVDNGSLILGPISFELKRGETIYVVGKNGSGKSTLLKTLSGVQINFDGEVIYNGESLSTESRKLFLRSIAYLTQADPSFTLTVSALFQMIIASQPILMNDVMHKLCEIGLSLEKISNSRVCDLSPGEKKKLFLALVFSSRNNILLLDEPTNHLDSEAVYILIDWIEKSSKSLVIVTHDTRILNIRNEKLQKKIQL